MWRAGLAGFCIPHWLWAAHAGRVAPRTSAEAEPHRRLCGLQGCLNCFLFFLFFTGSLLSPDSRSLLLPSFFFPSLSSTKLMKSCLLKYYRLNMLPYLGLCTFLINIIGKSQCFPSRNRLLLLGFLALVGLYQSILPGDSGNPQIILYYRNSKL